MRLDETSRRTPFQTPEGYFETLPQRTRKRIARQAKRSRSRRRAARWAVAPLAAAALTLIALWQGGFFAAPEAEPMADVSLEDVSDEALVSYLEAYEVSEEELLEAAGEDAAALALLEDAAETEDAIDWLDEEATLEEIEAYY